MKDVAKKRKRGFAIGESDEARKDEIRRREEKREARDMEIRINKVRHIHVIGIVDFRCGLRIVDAGSQECLRRYKFGFLKYLPLPLPLLRVLVLPLSPLPFSTLLIRL